MVRLHIVVEGQTEETFVKRLLVQELSDREVFTDVHRVTTGRRRGRVFRGGLTSYQQLKNDLVRWMKQDQNPEAWFTTMVDLYRLPADFPGYERCHGQNDPVRRVECLEACLGDDLGYRRFIPYLQLHEFESLLFSDPAQIIQAFPSRADAVRELEQVRSRFPSPEHINDGAESAPSKRISSVVPEYGAAKPSAGPLILEHIGMAALRRECSHFNSWVRRLESLSGSSQ